MPRHHDQYPNRLWLRADLAELKHCQIRLKNEASIGRSAINRWWFYFRIFAKLFRGSNRQPRCHSLFCLVLQTLQLFCANSHSATSCGDKTSTNHNVNTFALSWSLGNIVEIPHNNINVANQNAKWQGQFYKLLKLWTTADSPTITP